MRDLTVIPETTIYLKTKLGFYKTLKFPKVLIACPCGRTIPKDFKEELDRHLEGGYCTHCFNTGKAFTDNKYVFRLIYEKYPLILNALERSQKEEERDAWEAWGERVVGA